MSGTDTYGCMLGAWWSEWGDLHLELEQKGYNFTEKEKCSKKCKPPGNILWQEVWHLWQQPWRSLWGQPTSSPIFPYSPTPLLNIFAEGVTSLCLKTFHRREQNGPSLGLVGSPCSPRDSQEYSPTPQFFSTQLSLQSNSHIQWCTRAQSGLPRYSPMFIVEKRIKQQIQAIWEKFGLT